MTSLRCCIAFALLPWTLACGDDAPIDEDTGSTSGASTSGSTGGSFDGPATLDASAGETTGASQTASVGDSTGTATTSASTGESTGVPTTDDGASSTDGTGGGVCEPVPDLDGSPCMADGDCDIYGDCCNCIAYNPDMRSPGNCGGNCPQDVCEQLALDTAVCDGGFCRVLGLSCDQTAVLCDSLPPECDLGTLPGVADDCWSGECVPVEFCDWVPDCDACPDDQICVIVQTEECEQYDCVAPIPECGNGGPTCDCFGQFVCEAPYTTCAIEGDAVVCS